MWRTSARGPSLAFVTNTERAMVLLLDGAGDAGEHAVDPGAEDRSEGFVLANGQHDQYPDADTGPVADAFGVVRHVVATGSWPVAAHRVADR